MEFKQKSSYNAQDLMRVVTLLRDPENGCPWDKDQTHESLRRDLLEETYEVIDAIDSGETSALQEELGDVLLHIALHARIEEEKGNFTFDDVCDGICKKLIHRHPHVFANLTVETPDEVLQNWDEIKKQEKGHETYTQTLQAVPKALPALMRAQKLQKRAAKAGMDFESTLAAIARLEEEIAELKLALETSQGAASEVGDILFSAVNVARFVGCDAEQELTAASEKFLTRFAGVEALCAGEDMKEKSADELEELWQAAKKVTTE